MQAYRIYETADIETVITQAPYVTMSVEPDDKLFCVGTGRSPEEIAAEAFNGHLGATKVDEHGRAYVELFTGY